MLFPATTFDPARCRADFFFCLSFSEIPQRELKAIVRLVQFSTPSSISVKQYRKTVRIRVAVKQIECAFPLTGMATFTSYEHNIIYRAVHNAESAVDSIYDFIVQAHHMIETMKGDFEWQQNLPARLV